MNAAPSLTQSFDQVGVPLDQRDAVTALAAARRVAYGLPMPQEPVGSPSIYFRTNHSAAARQALGDINEVSVIDFDLALKAAQLYWLARYKVLHQPDSSEAVQAVTGLVQSMIAGEQTADLGMAHNSLDSTRVVSVDGRTTLVSNLATLSAASEALRPTLEALWGTNATGG